MTWQPRSTRACYDDCVMLMRMYADQDEDEDDDDDDSNGYSNGSVACGIAGLVVKRPCVAIWGSTVLMAPCLRVCPPSPQFVPRPRLRAKGQL